MCVRVCCVQCKAAYRTVLCVCVCVVLAKAGGRFIVAVSWPLRGLLHVKVNSENYKVILLACLVFSPQITPASRGKPTGTWGVGGASDPCLVSRRRLILSDLSRYQRRFVSSVGGVTEFKILYDGGSSYGAIRETAGKCSLSGYF